MGNQRNKNFQKRIQNDTELDALFQAVDNGITWAVGSEQFAKYNQPPIGQSQITDLDQDDDEQNSFY